jgi:hypothetical protein
VSGFFGFFLAAAARAVAAQPSLGTIDAALTRLFTPVSAPRGRYLVYRSDRSIADLSRELQALDPNPAPGAWAPTRPEAHDAFGQEGAYDRPRLARLFRGRRVTLVRGSIARGGTRTAYTLVSPYPDASLSTVVEATMVIEFHVPPLQP